MAWVNFHIKLLRANKVKLMSPKQIFLPTTHLYGDLNEDFSVSMCLHNEWHESIFSKFKNSFSYNVCWNHSKPSSIEEASFPSNIRCDLICLQPRTDFLVHFELDFAQYFMILKNAWAKLTTIARALFGIRYVFFYLVLSWSKMLMQPISHHVLQNIFPSIYSFPNQNNVDTLFTPPYNY